MKNIVIFFAVLTASAVLAGATGKKTLSGNNATAAGTSSKDNQTKLPQDHHRAPKADSKPMNVHVELGRVNKQLQEIRALPISKESKIQKQKALLDREIATAKGKLHDIESTSAEKTSADAKDRAQRLRDAIVDFLQKLSSINPQLK
jgi:hypothetical protein